MTPTCDEETELARVMLPSVFDAPLDDYTETARHDMLKFAQRAIAAGYTKADPAAIRNQALDDAVKDFEFSAEVSSSRDMQRHWRESAARIRALKT